MCQRKVVRKLHKVVRNLGLSRFRSQASETFTTPAIFRAFNLQASSRPPAHPSRACAPCPSHCAGPYGTGSSSSRTFQAAMDTYFSSCTRMTMPFCLHLRSAAAFCSRECRTDVRVRAHVFLSCVDDCSGVLWTQRLILGCFHVYIDYIFA